MEEPATDRRVDAARIPRRSGDQSELARPALLRRAGGRDTIIFGLSPAIQLRAPMSPV